jgi:glycosyltransferase involved in cell wall biosynthesis
MNILLINHYAGSPEMGMEYRPYYFSREWVLQGHNVWIFAATYSHLRKTQAKRGVQTISGIKYRWIKTNKYKGNGIGRVISMFVFVSTIILKIKSYTNKFKPDIVIASSTYPFDIFAAKKIAKRYNAKLIFEVHDLWPLSPIEIGAYSTRHPFIKMMQYAENYAYKHCNTVVSLLPKAKEHMIDHGLQPEKFYYIPNGFDPAEWKYPKNLDNRHKTFFSDLKKRYKLIIGYAGGHNKSNKLDTLIDAIKISNNKDLCFVLVGKGTEKPMLQKKCIDENIKNIYFLDQVDKQLIPALLEEMDVLFLGWAKNPLYRFGISPNKLLDYMMAGKFIIHAVKASNDLVKEANCGISIEPENPEKLAEVFNQIKNMDKNELDIIGARGKTYVQNNFTYSVLSNAFLQIMEEI